MIAITVLSLTLTQLHLSNAHTVYSLQAFGLSAEERQLKKYYDYLWSKGSASEHYFQQILNATGDDLSVLLGRPEVYNFLDVAELAGQQYINIY